ncbi:MAG: hypothetical protein ABI266_07390 [Ginsengibacter sp.]
MHFKTMFIAALSTIILFSSCNTEDVTKPTPTVVKEWEATHTATNQAGINCNLSQYITNTSDFAILQKVEFL